MDGDERAERDAGYEEQIPAEVFVLPQIAQPAFGQSEGAQMPEAAGDAEVAVAEDKQ